MIHARIPLCISPKDVSRVTGRNVRNSYELMMRIKKRLNKPPHQVLSVTEFCEYMGLSLEEVIILLSEQRIRKAG